MNRRSLTFRLISWYGGLLLLLGVIFAAFTYASFDRYVEVATQTTLASRAGEVWRLTADLLGDKTALSDLIERRFAPEAQNRLIRISDGHQVYYQSGMPADHGFDPARVPLPHGDAISAVTRSGDLFVYAKGFEDADGHTVIIESGRAADLMETAEHHLVASLIFGLPLLLIFAAGGGYVLIQRALTPVERMIEAVEALTFNSPQKRLPLAGTGDRIEALGRTLNRMLERLDNAYQHASRFSADAAHELRTPLAIMRGELELLAGLRGLAGDTQIAVANVLEETVRLGQIVDSLIAMSQLDSMAGKGAHRAVDLFGLAAETIDQIRLLAVEKGIAIAMRPGPRSMAAGDRDRLKQVLVNLLDNAIKYTQAGGLIQVSVEETDGTVILVVRDTGIGIAPEDIPHIFDRFFRASTDRGEIGAGLGLAIVRSICTAHGGQITVESMQGVGSIFRVILPRATDRLEAEILPTAQPENKAHAA